MVGLLGLFIRFVIFERMSETSAPPIKNEYLKQCQDNLTMYHTVYLDERVSLSPVELNDIRAADDVKGILITKLRERHEGKCNANGHVRPGSMELLARSVGLAENGRFTGNLLYDCKVKCDILYPTTESPMDVTVIKVNKMGAYAVFEEAIRVLLPRDMHLGNSEFDAIKEGDVLKIVLERSRFQTNDPFITAVGRLLPADAVAEVPEVVSAAAANLPPLIAAEN